MSADALNARDLQTHAFQTHAFQTHAFQTDDPRLEPIHAKVLAGERLSASDAAHPLSHRRHSRRGLAGELRSRAHARRQDVFQCQPPYQSHECLCSRLPPLRFRPQEGRARRLHHGARRSLRNRRLRIHRGGHRVPHRRRTASRPAVPVFSRSLLGPEAALPAGASQSVHHGRSRVSLEARQTLDSRDAASN